MILIFLLSLALVNGLVDCNGKSVVDNEEPGQYLGVAFFGLRP